MPMHRWPPHLMAIPVTAKSSPFDGQLPAGWTADLQPNSGWPEDISNVWAADGCYIGSFKHDTLKPVLITDDDHLRYIWWRYNQAGGENEHGQLLSTA